MSLHPKWVDFMLDELKDMELRRIFPRNVRPRTPIYFVQTGTAKGGTSPTVRVRAEIECIDFVDVRMLYASKRDAFAKTDPMDPDHPGYRYVVCLTYGDRWYSPRLTWQQAIAYQGDRPGIYLICLRDITAVRFPISYLGLSLAPQSYAYAKKLPPFEKNF